MICSGQADSAGSRPAKWQAGLTGRGIRPVRCLRDPSAGGWTCGSARGTGGPAAARACGEGTRPSCLAPGRPAPPHERRRRGCLRRPNARAAVCAGTCRCKTTAFRKRHAVKRAAVLFQLRGGRCGCAVGAPISRGPPCRQERMGRVRKLRDRQGACWRSGKPCGLQRLLQAAP